MSTPTKAQWDWIAARLSGPYGSVKLRVDGYAVDLQIQRVSRTALRYEIVVYVDGYLKVANLLDDCEERRRFYRPVERHVHNAKLRADLTKIYGKRRAKAKGVDQKRTSYRPSWPTFAPLRRHLLKHNQVIQLVVRDYDRDSLQAAGVDLTGTVVEALATEETGA